MRTWLVGELMENILKIFRMESKWQNLAKLGESNWQNMTKTLLNHHV
jgi:hypothetical protein